MSCRVNSETEKQNRNLATMLKTTVVATADSNNCRRPIL